MSAKRRVYVETTLISYLAARQSRDLVIAARQQMSRDWWQRRDRFHLFVSQYVVDEAGAGDDDAARQRMELIQGIPHLASDERVTRLALSLVSNALVPRKAATDALHLAVATVHAMDVLVTWNCKHLANAVRLGSIVRAIRDEGFEAPIICTPEEMLED